jgi:hypothetical protein
MNTASAPARLAYLAADQWGLFTRRQAEAKGVSRATLHRLSHGAALIERVAPGVYHLGGAPLPDDSALRAAWLQLAPETPAWERKPEQGVVSHRSAALLLGLGHLPADRHEFITAVRRQSRRPDVRIHRGSLEEQEWAKLRGLPVTTPARTASDLLADQEEPEAVARVIVDALRGELEQPAQFAAALSPRAARLGLRRGDGLAVLATLLNLTENPHVPGWLQAAGRG